MDAQVLARWQFGITTVYHFFFVPVTLGTAWIVAILETRWRRTGDIQWLRMTKFFAKLFLINFAAGVATGIVQEFQFGMNWSEYSRFVGDVFGVPLALEALIAFFFESTFIGLWIFGWDKLGPRTHNLMMYFVALGSTLSAAFILAANCFMQNPVGATYNNGRAELIDFGELFTNPFFLVTFPHQIGAGLMAGGSLLVGIAGWKLAQAAKESTDHPDADVLRRTARMGAWTLLAATLVVFGSGHAQAQVEAEFQPMKLAASEGLIETTNAAGFSIVGIFTQQRNAEGITEVHEVFSWEVPYVLSFLAFNDPNAEVKGIADLTNEYLTSGYQNVNGETTRLQKEFVSELDTLGVDPVPNVMMSYYSFRLMIGLGSLAALGGLAMLWVTRKGGAPKANKVWRIGLGVLPFLPVLGNSFGWILTEMGRQPWVVYGVLPTWMAVSPNVSAGEVLASMAAFGLVYGIIAVIVLKLFFVHAAKDLPEVTEPTLDKHPDAPISFAY
ncbi:hypothetical protein HMPREF1531_01160 [Propionibacterium sp. oral taxon 192 str. F0372]|uniref:cytochrome ubiquinol oxidase subunit I n=1 Tax=Propionibacterium sp. oral taxon 192 TaxID=671222 RepID=UPI000353913F|nr:cytochrome ubiquinol oxidase subunit I [Propionibacterium sp. oral taxon 192]EPH03735.1 hypothetical protein HMPREF1531_01160 [Propionibacterium sp. oral taxon 192 str. F0372]